jgi:hypothetical protein
MLGMKTYSRDYIKACRSRVDASLRAYRKQVGKAPSKEFEHRFFNDQVLLLDYMFVHRLTGIEGKDGGVRGRRRFAGEPEIVANEVIEILGDSERFCFHMAETMERADAEKWVASARKRAIANAKRALAPLVARDVELCAIVAKAGEPGSLNEVLASHPRIHTAEGHFYRDVLRVACSVPVHLVAPSVLDASKVGKLARPPWGKDQKLAALAAWSVMGKGAAR